ncbi:maleylpyruvate isomerase family mycothiol-dependent enzyme [Amycolatopsis australiensis]|uniref:TIGR03083 family protein n=1 Tax=Amycolatopsis australiensis TaxID=546364 RepID=A0A1K1S322_9PSEU|nr:maleylpyruvate isomerase family mycothiol-dependent enzyme [Amycolatopsis australiensis]SFW78763.1 TIGR03083 family protein [Amycolatopsis australiensis]
MSELVDRTIAVLRAEHDRLAGLVRTRTDDQLAATGGAAEWTVAQVLSRLGSGAEIGRAPIARALGETVPAEDNPTIWARWDASAPRVQAEGFLEHNGRWLETVEALTSEQRSSLTVDLGFLPEPVPLLTALGMRLSEVANHSWDVRVAFDPDAGVDAGSAAVLVELLTGPLGFMLGFLAKPAELAQPVSVAVPGAGLVIDDAVTVVPRVESPSATFTGPAEAFVRLLSGRLKPPYEGGVTVEGSVTLDELRRVFPGF